jgi:hypothetical protein
MRTMVRNCAPENLEIPRCAIAHLRFNAAHRPGMTLNARHETNLIPTKPFCDATKK